MLGRVDMARTEIGKANGGDNVEEEDEAEEEEAEAEAEAEGEEEEREPLLEYQRLPGVLLTESEQSASVTCVNVQQTFLLTGLSDGVVLQTDLSGRLIRRLDCHSDRITALSVDASGRYLASSSDDGTVCVHDTGTNGASLANVLGPDQTQEPGDARPSPQTPQTPRTPTTPHQVQNQTPLSHGSTSSVAINKSSSSQQQQQQAKTLRYDFRYAVKAVALDPLYASRREKVFVSGGLAGKCVVSRRGWFTTDHSELHKGEGTVSCVVWAGSLVAWSNDTGVKVYDYDQQERIAFIERPPWSPAMAACPCRLFWQDSATLMVAWADSIKVVRIRERENDVAAEGLSAAAKSGARVFHSQAVDVQVAVDDSHSGTIGDTNTSMDKDNHRIGTGRSSNTRSWKTKEKQQRVAEILLWFRTDVLVCGIAPFGTDRIAILGYPLDIENSHFASGSEHEGASHDRNNHNRHSNDNDDDDGVDGECGGNGKTDGSFAHTNRAVNVVGTMSGIPLGQQPELRVLSRADGTDVSSDTLPIRGFERNQPLSYSLAWHTHVHDPAGLPFLFVVSPLQIVLARPTDTQDHVAWAVRRQHYQRALALAHRRRDDRESDAALDDIRQRNAAAIATLLPPKADVPDFPVGELAQLFVKSLLGSGQYVRAAQLCRKYVAAMADAKVEESAVTAAEADGVEADVDARASVSDDRNGRVATEFHVESAARHGRASANRIAREWEVWVERFAALGQLGAIAPVLPVASPCLGAETYLSVVSSLAGCTGGHNSGGGGGGATAMPCTASRPHSLLPVTLGALLRCNRVQPRGGLLFLSPNDLARAAVHGGPCVDPRAALAEVEHAYAAMLDASNSNRKSSGAKGEDAHDNGDEDASLLLLSDALVMLYQAVGRPLDAIVVLIHALRRLLPGTRPTSPHRKLGNGIDDRDRDRIDCVFQLVASSGLPSGVGGNDRHGNIRPFGTVVEESEVGDGDRLGGTDGQHVDGSNAADVLGDEDGSDNAGGGIVRTLAAIDPARVVRVLVELFPAFLGSQRLVATAGDVDGPDPTSSTTGNSLPGTAAGSDSVDPYHVVRQLAHDRRLVLSYLDALLATHRQSYHSPEYAALHDLHVRLLVEFNRSALGAFLRWSTLYSLDAALRVCEEAQGRLETADTSPLPPPSSPSSSNATIDTGGASDAAAVANSKVGLGPELVLILARMGGDANMKRALRLILDGNPGAVPAALDFITQQTDHEELWVSLLTDIHFVQNPSLVGALLQHVGRHRVDAHELIRAIPNNMELPDLRERLMTLMLDTRARSDVLKNCVAVLHTDVLHLSHELHRHQRRGTLVQGDRARCGLCDRLVRTPPAGVECVSPAADADAPDVVVFASGECYHQSCLDEAADLLREPRMQDPQGPQSGRSDGAANDVATRERHCRLYAKAKLARQKQLEQQEHERQQAFDVGNRNINYNQGSSGSGSGKQQHQQQQKMMHQVEPRKREQTLSQGRQQRLPDEKHHRQSSVRSIAIKTAASQDYQNAWRGRDSSGIIRDTSTQPQEDGP